MSTYIMPCDRCGRLFETNTPFRPVCGWCEPVRPQ